VEVVKVLPTVSDPAILDLEDEATVNVQALAVSLRAVVMNADHAAIIICKHVPQLCPEAPSRLPAIPAELDKARLATLVVSGQ
jgi:hypothetical protein